MKARLIFHALAIVALTAMVVFAQEPTVQSTKSSQQPGTQANSEVAGRDLNSEARRYSNGDAGEFSKEGQATNPKVTPHQPPLPAKNSAHASESTSTTDTEANGKSQGGTVDKDGKSSDQVQTPGTMQEKPDVNGSETAKPGDENVPKRHRPGDGSSPD